MKKFIIVLSFGLLLIACNSIQKPADNLLEINLCSETPGYGWNYDHSSISGWSSEWFIWMQQLFWIV